MTVRVLIIERDKAISGRLAAAFGRELQRVESTAGPSGMLEAVRVLQPTLVML
ncbi:MAG: hypothetical protein JNG84_03455, partial [Archangium sp.]|nr:hypothetical protein [Archangium sp.]